MDPIRSRRYIFIDFENLKKVKFKKLEKVCDKVFIMINADEDQIPFDLVVQMQRLGRGVKWIPVHETEEMDMNYLLCFLMGQLHNKARKDVEFAILSNDPYFDALVNFINADGRSCLRVKRKRTQEEKESRFEDDTHTGHPDETPKPFLPEVILDQSTIDTIARNTIGRLRRSGTRPTGLQMLRNFILLNNQELIDPGNVDKVIQRMQQMENISLAKSEVIYNF